MIPTSPNVTIRKQNSRVESIKETVEILNTKGPSPMSKERSTANHIIMILQKRAGQKKDLKGSSRTKPLN